jgi:RNA polymerase sigma-70 factor (ECF subfamily)
VSGQVAENVLIDAAVAGDRLALNELFFQQFDSLRPFITRRLAARASCWMTVDDALQETLVRAIRGIATFEPRGNGSFGVWLQTIARNTIESAAEAQAAQKRGGGHRRERPCAGTTSSLVDLVELLVDDDGSPSAVAARQEMIDAVQIGIAGLPDSQREAIRRRYIDGQSVCATAEAMRRSPGAIQGLVHRAKCSLREALGRSSRWFGRK